MKEASKYGGEDASKPHIASQLPANEKDKIMEQYYTAKRQLKPNAR